MLESETEETRQVLADPHRKEVIRKDQEDNELDALRANIEAQVITLSMHMHDEMLYYLSGKNEELRRNIRSMS